MPSSCRRCTRGKAVRRSKRRLRRGPSMKRRRRVGGVFKYLMKRLGQSRSKEEDERYKQALSSLTQTITDTEQIRTCTPDDSTCPCILGRGNQGTVYKVSVNGSFVAVKTTAIKKDKDCSQCVRDAEFEGDLMNKLNNLNIVKVLYGPTYVNGVVCTVLEYCEKSLEDKIKTSTTTNWPLQERLNVLIQIATGMQYLVNHKIVHRDLKPANVLLATREAREVAKIADFGLCCILDSKRQEMNRLPANIGTPKYMAPEVFDDTHHYVNCNPILTDIYSFGILMWSVLSGLKPYEKEVIAQGLNLWTLCDKISNSEFRPNPEDVTQVWKTDATKIKPIIEIMEKCWKHEPSLRYQSFEDVKSQLLAQ